jgi:hypothetical protein
VLWTDRDFVSSNDLITLDAEVQSVASAEEITLDDPSGGAGIIHRAIEEAGDKLFKYLQLFGGYLNSGTVSANHYAAVMNVGLPSVNRSKILMGQIVVSSLDGVSWPPVKRWVAYWALHAFFRDAANRTLKDRYATKEERYRAEANGAHWDALRTLGVPIVTQPLPCPAAVWEPNTGNWGDGNVSQVAGSGTVEGSYDVVVTWVDQDPGLYGSNTGTGSFVNNAESAPSVPATIALVAGNVAVVDIASLVAPTGAQPLGSIPFAIVEYMRATGWNVYAGPSGGPLCLQTPTPIPIATKSFTFPGDPLTGTALVGPGQYAERNLSLPMGIIQRG